MAHTQVACRRASRFTVCMYATAVRFHSPPLVTFGCIQFNPVFLFPFPYIDYNRRRASLLFCVHLYTVCLPLFPTDEYTTGALPPLTAGVFVEDHGPREIGWTRHLVVCRDDRVVDVRAPRHVVQTLPVATSACCVDKRRRDGEAPVGVKPPAAQSDAEVERRVRSSWSRVHGQG